MKVGNRIRSYRKRMDMTQKELADKLDVTSQAVSSWEMDRTEPSIDVLQKMGKIFGCSAYDLLDEKDPLAIQVNTPLTDKEYAIIKYYREADETIRTMMLNMVGYIDWRRNDAD